MGELHFLHQALLREQCPDEPRVLDRGADLRRNRRHEFLIAGRERVTRSPLGQIDDAQRLTTLRRGPHDRYGHHRAAPIRGFSLACHLIAIDDHGVLRAKDARRDTAPIIHGDRGSVTGLHALGCHNLQRIGHAVVHQNRCAPGADGLGDLAQDRGGGFLEPHGATEDLTDRIEEIDLFVAFGELGRRVLHLHRRLQNLGYDGGEEPEEVAERQTASG